MIVRTTSLPGVLVVEPEVFSDDRGWFVETFRAERYAVHGIGPQFVQDNRSCSARGVIRGLHYQLARAQAKLVHVTRGAVFDVVVDIRVGSPTFGRWESVELAAETHRQLWIPGGFAHGFQAITDHAEVSYKVTVPYDRQDSYAIRWNDPEIGIAWPLQEASRLSPTDLSAPLLRDASLPRFE